MTGTLKCHWPSWASNIFFFLHWPREISTGHWPVVKRCLDILSFLVPLGSVCIIDCHACSHLSSVSKCEYSVLSMHPAYRKVQAREASLVGNCIDMFYLYKSHFTSAVCSLDVLYCAVQSEVALIERYYNSVPRLQASGPVLSLPLPLCVT